MIRPMPIEPPPCRWALPVAADAVSEVAGIGADLEPGTLLAAYRAGARRFDAALGGLGGCPFAPGATGNVCTEDLVNLCHEIGLTTGLVLQHLIGLSLTLPNLVGHDVPGQIAKAGHRLDLHLVPDRLRLSA